MRFGILFLALCGTVGSAFGTPLFGADVDLSQFRLTLFASGLALPQAMQQMSDGSILVQQSPGYTGGELVRFVGDGSGHGIIDSTPLYTTPNGQGPLTQLVTAGNYFLQGTFGDHTISVLQSVPTPSSPLTEVVAFQFDFPADWWHSSAGLAVRPTPGQAGFYDLVFNVGSAGDTTPGGQITLNGLGLTNQQVYGASLYMVTLDLTGGTPVYKRR